MYHLCVLLAHFPVNMADKKAEGGNSTLIATAKMAVAVAGIFGSFGYFAILQV